MISERWSLFAVNLMKPSISLMLLSGRKAGLQEFGFSSLIINGYP